MHLSATREPQVRCCTEALVRRLGRVHSSLGPRKVPAAAAGRWSRAEAEGRHRRGGRVARQISNNAVPETPVRPRSVPQTARHGLVYGPYGNGWCFATGIHVKEGHAHHLRIAQSQTTCRRCRRIPTDTLGELHSAYRVSRDSSSVSRADGSVAVPHARRLSVTCASPQCAGSAA